MTYITDFFLFFLKLHSPIKDQIFKTKAIIQIWSYITNLGNDAVIKHLLAHRREYWVNLIEPVTTEAYGVTKVIIQIWSHRSNLDTDAVIKHFSPHRMEYWVNLIEPVNTEDYGVARACQNKIHVYTSNISQISHLKSCLNYFKPKRM